MRPLSPTPQQDRPPKVSWLAQVIRALHQFARDEKVKDWRFVLVLVVLVVLTAIVVLVPAARFIF